MLNIVSGSYKTTRLFACAIHKRSLRGRDPVEMAFEDLCKRFDFYLDRLRADGDAQRGMIILDKTTRETSLQKLSKEFRKVGTRWGSLKNIADTPFFVDSKASRMVQLADHIAYAVFRRYNTGDAQYLDLIAHRFDAVDGVIHGSRPQALGHDDLHVPRLPQPTLEHKICRFANSLRPAVPVTSISPCRTNNILVPASARRNPERAQRSVEIWPRQRNLWVTDALGIGLGSRGPRTRCGIARLQFFSIYSS